MAEVGEPLSVRELGVLGRLVDGSTNREIARDLGISHNTVKVHLRNIFTKLGVSSRTEAITVALQKGLITVEGSDSAQAIPPADSVPDIPASGEEDGAESNGIDSTASPTKSYPWRLIALGLLLMVVLLVGVLIGPQLRGDNGADGSQDEAIEQPIAGTNWLSARPLPSGRADMALVAVGLDLYQIGGEVDAGVVNIVDVFETQSGQWRSASAKPTAVASTDAAVLFGEIYVPGGRLVNGEPTSVVEAYSPVNNAWRPVAPLPKPVAGGLSLVDDGLLYVLGGWDGEQYLAEAYVYNPDTDSWRLLPSMTHARQSAAGGVLTDGLYVVGGFNGVEELKLCEYYDPDQEIWSDCPSMTLSRSQAGAAVLGNRRLFIIGGGADGEVSFGEVYDSDSGSWERFDMPMLGDAVSWYGLGATNVETRIYALGGRQGEGIIDQNYIYAPFIHRTFLPAVGGDT